MWCDSNAGFKGAKEQCIFIELKENIFWSSQQIRNLSREIKSIKKNQMENLIKKSTVTEVKNSPVRLQSGGDGKER